MRTDARCIRAKYQNNLGGFIMRELMQRAEVLELSVLKSNVRAKRFYARLGFVEIGQSAHHILMR